MCKKITVLFYCLLPMICQADFKDPTKPDYLPQPSTNAVVDISTPPADEKLVLYAIWITAKTRWANINGVSAKQGQTILPNVKITEITKNSVSLIQNGNPKTLRLLQRPKNK